MNNRAPRSYLTMILGTVIVACLVIAGYFGVLRVADADDEFTVAPVPESAFIEGEPLDRSLVPDYIPALDNEGKVVGNVRGSDAMPDDPIDRPIPVFADDLTTIVGYHHPGSGYIPLGAAPPTPSVRTFGMGEDGKWVEAPSSGPLNR